MKRDEDIIEQINTLWVPVYPFMADHVLKVSGVGSGDVLDLGPFAGGLAVSLLVKSSGFRAKVMDESERVLRWAGQQAREKGCSSRLTVCRASIEPIPEPSPGNALPPSRLCPPHIRPCLPYKYWRVLRAGG